MNLIFFINELINYDKIQSSFIVYDNTSFHKTKVVIKNFLNT